MCKAFKYIKKINNKKPDNRGSALVSVLIAVFFVAMVITIMLFVAMKNYKARVVDYEAKQNFYEAEKAMDELKTVMLMDCSSSCKDAYVKVLDDYINLSGEERQKLYYTQFIEAQEIIWKNRRGSKDLLEAVRDSLSEQAALSIESVGEIEFNALEGSLVLKEVVVSCSTIEGYYSRIKSDIRVNAPQIDWGNGASNYEEREIHMEDYVVYSDWRRD